MIVDSLIEVARGDWAGNDPEQSSQRARGRPVAAGPRQAAQKAARADLGAEYPLRGDPAAAVDTAVVVVAELS
jgi:hypothetical protein